MSSTKTLILKFLYQIMEIEVDGKRKNVCIRKLWQRCVQKDRER